MSRSVQWPVCWQVSSGLIHSDVDRSEDRGQYVHVQRADVLRDLMN